MKFLKIKVLILCLVLTLSGCSIDLQVTPPSTSVVASPTIIPNSSLPTTKVPITWASLNLTGKIVYVSRDSLDNGVSPSIRILDLSTGGVTTIYRSPEAGWIFYVTISPDGKQLVMSSIISSSRALYIMPLDAATPPQTLFPPPTPHDRYTQAEWAPDGKSIYYTHYNDNEPPQHGNPVYDISRMSYPDGQHEKIAEHAFWPRISSDSSKLVYVAIDSASGNNELWLANADGSNSHKVAFSGAWIPDIIDAPILLPDGQSILFSAPSPTQSYQPNWFEKLMGIQLAEAHNIPSDWWSVPVTGGVPTRLTNLQTVNLFASLSPDKKHVASLSGDGIFVMDLDGSNLTRLISDSGVYGTVSWIP